MSNYSNTSGLIHIIINLDNLRDDLHQLLEQDSDFVENVDEYRHDTMAKGYKDEADRVVMEAMKKVNAKNITSLNEVVSMVLKPCYSNTTFYRNYEFDIIEINNKQFVVAVSYIS